MYIIKENSKIEKALKILNNLPGGTSSFFKNDVKDISSIFTLSKRTNNSVLVDFEKNEHRAATKIIPIKNIKITQPNIIKSRAEKMLLNFNKLPIINAVKYKNEVVIYDGHHRLTIHYLLGIKNIKTNLVEV